MKLTKHHSLKAADIVLSYLLRETTDWSEDKNEWYYENYANNREQGYCLRRLWGNLAISFGEQRASDQVVVYVGNCDSNGVPDEHTYENNAKYFDSPERAFKYILKQMDSFNKS